MTGLPDAVTMAIIQDSLQSVADEMFAVMRKTAMSSIIYEVLDMGTGVLDSKGRIASSGAGIPAFIGVLDKAVQVLLAKFSADTLHPGDIFITNDPYYGGVTHLNDLVVAMPVFAEGRLIAWTANIAHNSDVGGMAPGSISSAATEIYQEGLRLPAIRLVNAGEPIEEVFSILMCNSRMPEFLEGDLWAAIAALRTGAVRLEELARKYGVNTFEAAVEDFMHHGEQVTLATLANLLHGSFELTEEQDDGSLYNVKVTISATEFVVDLRDNPAQRLNPTNTSRDGTMICAQMALKALCDPSTPANDGTFRPIRLLTQEGTVFHAREPAPIAFYYETEIRVFDLIWQCLAQTMPERLGAGHFSTIGGTFIGGVHPDTGRHYTVIEPQVGGWGGRHGSDGNTALFSGFHGETYNCPAEISEARNGLMIRRLALNVVPGGEGAWRGGCGIEIDYMVQQDNSFLTIGYTRSRVPPWGLSGGREGTCNYALLIRAGGAVERHAFVTGLRVDRGDVIRIVTGAGGGYGDPLERDDDLVRQDLKNGLITEEHARRVYGLDIEQIGS